MVAEQQVMFNTMAKIKPLFFFFFFFIALIDDSDQFEYNNNDDEKLTVRDQLNNWIKELE